MTKLPTFDDAFIQFNQASSKSSSELSMFKTVIQKCNLNTVKTIWLILKLYKQSFVLLSYLVIQLEKWIYCVMADVSLFGGRGGASRGGVIGRPARGGVRNRVPQTDRQRLVDSFDAGEDYLHLANQLGINYSTARNIIRVWL